MRSLGISAPSGSSFSWCLCFSIGLVDIQFWILNHTWNPSQHYYNFVFPDFLISRSSKFRVCSYKQNCTFPRWDCLGTFCHQVFVSLYVCLSCMHMTVFICRIPYVSLKWIGLAPIVFSCICISVPVSIFYCHFKSFSLFFYLFVTWPFLPLALFHCLASPFSVISFHFILSIQSVFLFTLAPSLPFSIFLYSWSFLSPIIFSSLIFAYFHRSIFLFSLCITVIPIHLHCSLHIYFSFSSCFSTLLCLLWI